jgi:large subunit ribosomal protein L29
MKASEIREMSLDELEKQRRDLKEELFNLRFQQEISQLENPHLLKQKKRDLAKTITIINEKSRQS